MSTQTQIHKPVQPSTIGIPRGRHEQAAAALRESIPTILDQWEVLIRAEVPAALEQGHQVLMNNIPTFFTKLAQTLEEGAGWEAASQAAAVLQAHGERRAYLLNYSLDQVIQEYRLLRETLMNVLSDDARMDRDAWSIIHAALDYGIGQAATHYTKVSQTEYVALVAHELRTPLSAISNALYILEHIRLPEGNASGHVLLANRQVRQLARLVDDLVDVSRITKGRVALNMSRVSLAAIAQEAVETVHPVAEARGQDLVLSLPSEPLFVLGDAVRLEQILTNLLSNAIKYTAPGGDISMMIERTGDEAVISVSDAGKGIDSLVLPQIFDMFQQVEQTGSRWEGGLGIGLALVKRLVELHDGTVTASSDGLGKGARFVVRLPLHHTVEVDSAPMGI